MTITEIWGNRFSWEGLQSLVGYGYSNVRNIRGSVSRVDYFGGATFATNEYSTERDGISLGNFININTRDRIVGNFADHVVSDPLFMHEYGHTFDSQRWGLGYLFGIGIPSGISSLTSKPIQGEPVGVNTHSFRWYEMSANRRAARYFGKYYGVDWNRPYNPYGTKGHTIETYYPRRRR